MKKLSQRLKLTITVIAVLTLMSLILTFYSLHSASNLVKTAMITPGATSSTITPASSLLPITEGVPMISTEVTVSSPISEEYYLVKARAIATAQNNFRNAAWISMLMVLFVGSVIIYFSSRRALKPLEILSRKVSTMQIDNLTEPINMPRTNDEIAKLSKAFNEMRRRIYDSYSIQKNFSSNAAHELKTPLAVMQTQIEVFRMKKNRTLEEYDTFIDMVSNNTDRLSAVVTELLELTNECEISMQQNVSLKELLEEVLFELEDTANLRHIHLELDGENAIIKGNDRLLQRAFFNLMENAVKYNVADGYVRVSIARSNDKVTITIEDSGVGIPEEQVDQIFEPFFRVDKSRSREIGGSGLGLAIVKKVIDKHSGTISVKANPTGGSLFTVFLPG